MKRFLRDLKNQTYEPIEVKVREATSSDPWAAQPLLMQEIADATHDYAQYPKLFQILWKRLRDYQIHMHVQKALLLTEHLVRNGSDRFIRDARARADDVSKLRRYKYYNKDNEDIAADVRKKAKEVHEMLTNDDKLKAERERSSQLRASDVKGSHISSKDYRQSESSSTPATAASRDPYDNYSATSRAESIEAERKTEADRARRAGPGTKKKPAKAAAEENPFDESAQEDPFEQAEEEEQPKPKPKPKPKAKPKPKPVEEEYEEPAEEQPVAVPKIPKPAAAGKTKKTTKKALEEEEEPVDPFNPIPVQKGKKGGKSAPVDDVLASVMNPTSNRVHAAQSAHTDNIDFLTGQLDNTHMGGNWQESFDEENGGGGDGGHVEWGPEVDDDEDSDKQQYPVQPQRKPASSGDIWDIASEFTNIDNPATEKRKQDDGKTKKKEKTMSELAAKKPSVIIGGPIDGFAPTAASQPPNPFANSPYVSAPAYGAPVYGQPMGYGMPMGMGAPGGAPMPGYGVPGYPPANAPRRTSQPANNPYGF